MSLSYKIYDVDGELFAATRYAEDASFVMPEGGKLKVNGRIVWREGKEEFLANESADRFADVVRDRVRGA